jgi:hypothetical protein
LKRLVVYIICFSVLLNSQTSIVALMQKIQHHCSVHYKKEKEVHLTIALSDIQQGQVVLEKENEIVYNGNYYDIKKVIEFSKKSIKLLVYQDIAEDEIENTMANHHPSKKKDTNNFYSIQLHYQEIQDWKPISTSFWIEKSNTNYIQSFCYKFESQINRPPIV